jgi:hypothetical protein
LRWGCIDAQRREGNLVPARDKRVHVEAVFYGILPIKKKDEFTFDHFSEVISDDIA